MTKKIIGIGNAIVDVLCKVDDEFLQKNNLVKGSMSLIDEDAAKKLSHLKAEKITSGGSVANTIATLGQLGSKAVFVGKIGSDDSGKNFVSELEKTGATFVGSAASEKTSAKSFVLVTSDAQRTMCTFLGCASEISAGDIVEEIFANAAFLYLEGYLWDGEKTSSVLKKAIELAKKNGVKIAFSLSDSFCVARHRKDFLSLIENDLDLVFANESEALELLLEKSFSLENFSSLVAKNKNLIAVVTRSDNGCAVFSDKKIIEVATKKVEKPTDTTGAGDAFAAGFLHGLVKNLELEKCAKLGNDLAAKIIQKFGARFETHEVKNF